VQVGFYRVPFNASGLGLIPNPAKPEPNQSIKPIANGRESSAGKKFIRVHVKLFENQN
jgi:hypothetical protein